MALFSCHHLILLHTHQIISSLQEVVRTEKSQCAIVNTHYQDLFPCSALCFTCTCTQKYTDYLSGVVYKHSLSNLLS